MMVKEMTNLAPQELAAGFLRQPRMRMGKLLKRRPMGKMLMLVIARATEAPTSRWDLWEGMAAKEAPPMIMPSTANTKLMIEVAFITRRE